MPFSRSWVRALIGASGAALLLPVGLLVTIAVAATLGGGGFGGLDQLVGGPNLPTGAVASEQASALDAGVGTLPRERRARRAKDGTAGSATAGGGSGTATGGGSAGGRPSSGNGGTTPTSSTQPGAGKPVRPRPQGGSATTVGGSTTTPATTTSTSQNPVKAAGEQAQAVVTPVPVVGKPASDAVGTVVGLLAPDPGGP